MRNTCSLNNLFHQDRKLLYIILSVIMISVLTLTVVYAALSTTLNINGTAEVSAASWDIYLDNVQLNSKSTTTNIPTITDSTTASFSTTLSKPGDIYEFTIDVVNDGSIDAMIDSVTKTPTLTETQSNYLNYIVEYQNGENITTKQLVLKNSFVRLKVRVEFRKDISTQDLPTQSETLNLSFKVNYVQSNETGTSVKDNGVVQKAYKVVKGDLETLGSIIAIGDEQFYLIKQENENLKLFSKNNITTDVLPIQSTTAQTISYSTTNYWDNGTTLKSEYGTSYPANVYDSNSLVYNYIENYKAYLEEKGAEVEDIRLITIEELEELGCSRTAELCSTVPKWVYETSYWTGTAHDKNRLWFVTCGGNFFRSVHYTDEAYGIRPIIVIKM